MPQYAYNAKVVHDPEIDQLGKYDYKHAVMNLQNNFSLRKGHREVPPGLPRQVPPGHSDSEDASSRRSLHPLAEKVACGGRAHGGTRRGIHTLSHQEVGDDPR